LNARGVAVSEDARQRLLAQTDASVLDRWLVRAVTVSSADELFRD
jgi:hypothetical protein